VNENGGPNGSGGTDGGMIVSLSGDGKTLEFRPLGPDERAVSAYTTDFKVQRFNGDNVMLYKLNKWGVDGHWLPLGPPNTFGAP